MKKPPFRLALFCLFAAFPSFALFAADEPNKDKPSEPVIERAPEQGQTGSDEEMAALRAENKRLTTELDEARRSAESLQSDLSAAKSDLQKKLASVQNELAAEKKRADEATKRLSTIVPGVDQLTAEKSGLEAELANSRNAEASLRQQLASAQQAVSRATAAAPQLAELTAKLNDAESKLASTARSYSLAQAENELLKTASADNAKLTAEVQTLRQEKAALEARANAAPSPENSDLAGKLATTEDKLSTTLRSFSLLQAENEKLKADAAHANETAQSSATELENLRKEQSALEARANAAPPGPGNSSELAGKLAAAEDKLSTTLHSFSQLQAENENLKADVARANEKAQSSAAELETVRKEKSALEARAPSPPPSENPSDLAGKLASTEDKLSTVLRSYSLLQAENDRIKADAAHAEESAQASSAKTSGEAAARASALFDELRQTQARAAVLAEENSQLKTRFALVGSPPGSTLASPVRPGTAAAEAAVASTPASQNPPPSPAADRTHIVVAGDSLTKISRQYYGTPNRWDEILRANRDVIKNENVLPVGATLHIP